MTIQKCLGMDLFEFLCGTLCFLDLEVCLFPQVKEIFSHNFKCFLPFLSLFSFYGPYNVNVDPLGVVPEVLKLSSLSVILFTFCCSDWANPTSLPLSSLIFFFCFMQSAVESLQCIFQFSFVFFSSVTSTWYFLIFLSLWWSSHCDHPFLSWVWWANVWPLFSTLY